MDKQTTGWTRFYSALPSRFSAAPQRVVAHNPAGRAAPPSRRTYLIGAILRRQCVGDAATKRSFFEFSLCLSRACLGEKSILMYKWLKKTVFSPAVVPRRRAVAANLVDNLQETLLFSHLFLAYICLSRACLGKCVVFSIEFARQKRVKIAPSLQRRWCRSAILPRSQSPDGTAEQHRTYSGEYILETAETSATRVS